MKFSSRRARNRTAVCTGLALLYLLVGAYEQTKAQFYFGKNKVQYTRFDWQVMTTDHFRLYFYTD